MSKKRTILANNYAFEITDVEIENFQATGKAMTTVTIDILKDGEVVSAGKRFAFDKELDKEQIVAELTKTVTTFASDERVGIESAEAEAQTEQANALKDEMLGQKVEVETNSQQDEPTK